MMGGGNLCKSCCMHGNDFWKGSSRRKSERSCGLDRELEQVANELLPKILKMPFTIAQWRNAINRVCDTYEESCDESADYDYAPRRRPLTSLGKSKGPMCLLDALEKRVCEDPRPFDPPQPWQNGACGPPQGCPPNLGLPVIWVPKLPMETAKMLQGMPCELFRDIHTDCRGGGDEPKEPPKRKKSPKRKPSPPRRPRRRPRTRSRRRRPRRRLRSCRPSCAECQCLYNVPRHGQGPPQPYRTIEYDVPPPPQLAATSSARLRSKSSSVTKKPSKSKAPKKAKSSSSSSSSSAAPAAAAAAAPAPAAPAPPADDLFGAGGLFGDTAAAPAAAAPAAPANDLFGSGGLFGDAAAPAPAAGGADWLTAGTSPAPGASPGGSDWLTGGVTPQPAATPQQFGGFDLFD